MQAGVEIGRVAAVPHEYPVTVTVCRTTRIHLYLYLRNGIRHTDEKHMYAKRLEV
jgi:hypothetical protein